MSVIYKYAITPPEKDFTTKIKVVGLNSVLKVHPQDDKVYLWCEVNPYAVRECELELFIFPTGYDFPNNLEIEYLDTVFLYNEKIVLHIYYRLL